jgi:hypothetical protein
VKHCTQCGHLLGLGRFCTNCGAPVAVRDPLSDPIDAVPKTEPAEPAAAPPVEDWQESTAERPASPSSTTPPTAPPTVALSTPAPPSPARVPPVVVEPPPPPRFPLFADEVQEVAAPAPLFSSSPPAATASEAVEADEDLNEDEDWAEDEWDESGRPRAVWLAVAVAVLAALVLGAWFLGQKIGDDDPSADPTAGADSGASQAAERVDHTADASASAPKTAAPNVDVDGNATSYDASNMLDGVPETAWRTEGDASGMKIVFTFSEKTRITEVGLINGYAKKARDGGKVLDWYEGTRRLQQVTWIFAGGQTVRQDLSDDREVQTIQVEPVEVTKVVLKIVTTSEPGEGAARRDYTAISDVLFAES